MTHNEIINNIINGKILSEYNHANIITRYDGHDFFKFDCSGFVAWYIGTNGYLRALAEIKNYLKQTNLLKINRFYCQDFKHFYKNSTSFNYWKIHKNIMDINHDDVVVIIYDDGNGHMMIVDKIISKTDNSLELKIIDSTRLLHKNDTRKSGTSGIGYGEIKLTIDDKGVIYDAQNPTRTPVYIDAYVARPVK